MLAYLDALIAALTIRDTAEVMRLLGHPLVRILPEDARAEARAFAAGGRDPLAAPLRVMRLRHQTAELLQDTPVVADRTEAPSQTERATERATRTRPPERTRRTGRLVQMELPLSA